MKTSVINAVKKNPKNNKPTTSRAVVNQNTRKGKKKTWKTDTGTTLADKKEGAGNRQLRRYS